MARINPTPGPSGSPALSASRSTSPTISARPSLTFSAMLPVKPSHTITSAAPAYTSRASMLPVKLRPLDLSRRCASRVSPLPLVSSSPIERSPTRGDSTPRARRANTLPIAANCTRCFGRHSTLAPTSSSTAEPRRVGMVAASAGRSTPSSMPRCPYAAMTVAPVCPALKKASARPAATSAAAMATEASGRRRSAAAGASAIPIASPDPRGEGRPRRRPGRPPVRDGPVRSGPPA